jgi:hypothetical protein
MTLPDPSLDRPGGDEQGVQDRLPPSERNQDQQRTEMTHGLAADGSRPLTAEEREAAAHDTGVAERVYAPASERVPVEPVAGHRDFIENTDDSTPERQAASTDPTIAASTTTSSEPAFTRVERPSNSSATGYAPAPTSPLYASPNAHPTYNTEPSSVGLRRPGLPLGIGSAAMLTAGAVGVWLFLRWQRERNKPINRLRRQARHAAEEFSSRVPHSDEVVQPMMSLLAAATSAALVLMQQAQKQRPERLIESLSDADLQKRLAQLKKRWDPRRLELEKVSISRH